MKLAVVATHPIQYQAPWFRALTGHEGIDLQVYFCHRATAKDQAGAGFGVEFDWDTSLLDGYEYRFLENVSQRPSLDRFNGLDTPAIKDILSADRPDAVIVNGWNYRGAWQTIRACWSFKIPVMVRSDSHLLTERSLQKQLAKWPLYRWFIPRLDACLPVGTRSRDYFLHYGAKPDRIFTIPHAVDDLFFAREASRWGPDRHDLRERWGLPGDSVVFVFAGKFIEKKRPMDFVRAITAAFKAEPRVAALMVGDGPLRPACEEFARTAGAPISFAGFLNQSEIAQAYVAGDALVLPSDGGETWGLVVNEAMSCGLPCLVSDRVGCGPDLIASQRTGDVFQMGQIDQLSNLIELWAAQPDRVREMGNTAKERIRFTSVDEVVTQTYLAVQTVAARNRQ
jgi:glycosyltransferase involved in cell wall biosynthesis